MLNPALEFCMSACVTEMRGDYNFEKRCNWCCKWACHCSGAGLGLCDHSPALAEYAPPHALSRVS